MLFADRAEAGRRLAEALRHLAADDVVVVGLPRGGVPVAAEIARRLGAPLDVVVVRKLGVPFRPELAMGAVGEGGVRVVDRRVADVVGPVEFAQVESRERAEVERRARRFRGGRERVPLAGRTVVIVDDGIATGSTARAACRVVRGQGASRVVLAAPVGPRSVIRSLQAEADEVVCLHLPAVFGAVGRFYADFEQVDDDEVTAVLRDTGGAAHTGAGGLDEEATVSTRDVPVAGRLTIPAGAAEVVVFAHGSGSSRHSPRNREVAARLNAAGLGTLLFDLLTDAEATDRANVFDIALLGRRLVDATYWLRTRPETAGRAVGYFGASTGAAAALVAAAEPGAGAAAVVSRGGRPDLAGAALGRVRAPTLLVVGGHDPEVLELNRAAQRQLWGESELTVVPGATHLFEEPGALDRVAELAAAWFLQHLPAGAGPPAAPDSSAGRRTA